MLFQYSSRHNGAVVDELLAGYEGYLVADAHSVYDPLYSEQSVTEVACWAHCRRYFIQALESDPERAKQASAPIAALFRIERSIATAPRKKKESVRSKKSKDLVAGFFTWCQQSRDALLGGSPMAKAIGYALNQ